MFVKGQNYRKKILSQNFFHKGAHMLFFQTTHHIMCLLRNNINLKVTKKQNSKFCVEQEKPPHIFQLLKKNSFQHRSFFCVA